MERFLSANALEVINDRRHLTSDPSRRSREKVEKKSRLRYFFIIISTARFSALNFSIIYHSFALFSIIFPLRDSVCVCVCLLLFFLPTYGRAGFFAPLKSLSLALASLIYGAVSICH